MSARLLNIHSHHNYDGQFVLMQGNRAKDGGYTMVSAGIHPVLDAENAFSLLDKLPDELKARNVRAIGECGFDKNSTLGISEQLEIFSKQTELSAERGLPVIIHCVGRWNELERMFKEKQQDTPPWIIHGFRKMKLAGKFLELGAFLSFGEALLYDKTIHTAISDIPLSRIFLETDDKQFELRAVYEKLAELKGLSLEAVQQQMTDNFHHVFGFLPE